MVIQLEFMDTLCLRNCRKNLEFMDKSYTGIQQRIVSFFIYLSHPSELQRYNFSHYYYFIECLQKSSWQYTLISFIAILQNWLYSSIISSVVTAHRESNFAFKYNVCSLIHGYKVTMSNFVRQLESIQPLKEWVST